MSQIEPLYYDGGEPVYRKDVIHKDELRELVKEFRNEAPGVPDGHATLATKYSLEWAADELEERLND